jgi:hypothetical protein
MQRIIHQDLGVQLVVLGCTTYKRGFAFLGNVFEGSSILYLLVMQMFTAAYGNSLMSDRQCM